MCRRYGDNSNSGAGASQAKQLVEQFDVDRDGWIDVKEFEAPVDGNFSSRAVPHR